MADDLVEVGRVVKPHGIRGEVVVDVLSEVPGRLDRGNAVVVAGTPTTVASSRPHQGRLLVGFAFVADRTQAEGLRGALVQAPPVELEEADVFYAHELVGARVVGPDGEELGVVADIVLMPDVAGYDLLEVTRADGHRWLLPAADELVEADVDDDGQVVLHLVEVPRGLVDPGEADELPRDDTSPAAGPLREAQPDGSA